MCGPTIFHSFFTFLSSSVRGQWRILGTTWLQAQESLRQRYIRDLADDSCAESHPCHSRRQLRVRTASALYRQHGEENGMHTCPYGNLMRREGSV